MRPPFTFVAGTNGSLRLIDIVDNLSDILERLVALKAFSGSGVTFLRCSSGSVLWSLNVFRYAFLRFRLAGMFCLNKKFNLSAVK